MRLKAIQFGGIYERRWSPAPPMDGAQIWAVFVVGVALLVLLLIAAFLGWLPAHLADLVIRIGLAAAVGGFASFLPGLFSGHIAHPLLKDTRIGGALGVFIFVALLIWHPASGVVIAQELQTCRRTLASGSYDVAEDYCRIAATKDSKNADAPFSLGSALYMQGKYAQAVGHWNTSLELGNEKPIVFHNLYLAYHKLDRLERMYDAANELLKHAGDVSSWKYRGFYSVAYSAQALYLRDLTDRYYQTAVDNYLSYLEGSRPNHNARANLACLYAVHGSSAASARLRQLSILAYERSIGELLEYLKRLANVADRLREKGEFAGEFGGRSSVRCAREIKEAWRALNFEAKYASLQVQIE